MSSCFLFRYKPDCITIQTRKAHSFKVKDKLLWLWFTLSHRKLYSLMLILLQLWLYIFNVDEIDEQNTAQQEQEE